MSALRELHVQAFGNQVADWFDEAVEIWRKGYGQQDEPPVLLIHGGGYAGYGRAIADAGPKKIDGRLTQYQIRLFSNDRTDDYVTDTRLRRDLICHELGHVYEYLVLNKVTRYRSTHDSPTWRLACATATPYMLPELASIASDHGLSLHEVFERRASRVVYNPATKKSKRVKVDGIGPRQLCRWPHSFREAEARSVFIGTCEALQQSNAAVTM